MTTETNPPQRETVGCTVSLITGDRLCGACGYNLIGQTVTREPHYALLIVRCPECGEVASVQEYPSLRHWAARVRVVLAGVCLLALLAVWAGSAGIMCGFSIASAEECSRSYAQYVAQRHRDERAAAADAATLAAASASPTAPGAAAVVRAGPAAQTVTFSGLGVVIGGPLDFDVWWSQQDPSAILAEAGADHGIDWSGLWILTPGTLLVLALGCFWSIALLFVRRRFAALWAFAVGGLALVFMSIAIMSWDRTNFYSSWNVARWQLGAPIALASLVYLTLALAVGILIGRPIVRTIVRILLPPRLRASLAVLWIAEGKEMPGERH